MISGQLPICAGISGIVLVNANLAGAGLKGISAQVDTIPYSLLVSPGIRTPADLAGKRLGINRPETSADHALRLGLARIGIDRRDVEVVSVGEQPQRLAALQTGSIDGTVISPPGALQALGEGFRILVDLSELRVAYPHSLVIAREDFLRDQPDIARRFIEASAEGMLRFKADRALGLEVLARHLEVSDPEDLEGTYALFSRTITDPPVVSEEGMRALLAVLAETNATVAAAGTDEFLDMTFVRDLQREGRYERLRDDARHTSARRNDAR
jgi:NitT/TauT family transport system substrate-binding protein